MTSIQFELLNVDKLRAKIEKMGQHAIERVRAAMMIAGLAIHRDIIKSIKAEARGEPYVRYAPGGARREGTASAPGDAPHYDQGELASGVLFPFPDPKDEMAVLIVSKAPYSADLEFGTEKMAARPFMTPNFLANKPYTKEVIRLSLQGLTK